MSGGTSGQWTVAPIMPWPRASSGCSNANASICSTTRRRLRPEPVSLTILNAVIIRDSGGDWTCSNRGTTLNSTVRENGVEHLCRYTCFSSTGIAINFPKPTRKVFECS